MWIITPESLASAPVSQDLISESDSLWEELAQSVSWRGKLRPAKSWHSAWKKGGWIPRLCGRISKPSMAWHGADAWTSLLRDTRANPFLLLGKSEEKKIHATSGLKFGESWAKYDRATSSWKMCQGTFAWDSTECLEILPNSGSMQSGLLSRRPMSDHHNAGNASSSWPTPRTITGGGESAERKQDLGRTESGGGDLQAASQNWPTPDAGVINDSERVNQTVTLGIQAEKVLSQDPPRGLRGQQATGLESPNTSTLRLNPKFVEWLMGFPQGWTSLEPLGTRSAHSKPQSLLET